MECLTKGNRIVEAYNFVNTMSSEAKRKREEEEYVNKFLDSILQLKSFLQHRTSLLDEACECMHGILWLRNLQDDEYDLLAECIGILKNIHRRQIEFYVKLSRVSQKGIAVDDIKLFKNSLDELKECIQDVDDRFFNLPSDEEFLNDFMELESM